MQPEEKDKLSNNQNLPDEAGIESFDNNPDQPKRKKVRLKVRKKIRIKQKPSAKKLLKKIAARAFWVILIAGFIASLIIMIIELDVRDDRLKQQKKKAYPTRAQ